MNVINFFILIISKVWCGELYTIITFAFCSIKITRIPDLIKQIAIPDPMVPAPITAAVWISSGFVLSALAPLGSFH